MKCFTFPLDDQHEIGVPIVSRFHRLEVTIGCVFRRHDGDQGTSCLDDLSQPRWGSGYPTTRLDSTIYEQHMTPWNCVLTEMGTLEERAQRGHVRLSQRGAARAVEIQKANHRRGDTNWIINGGLSRFVLTATKQFRDECHARTSRPCSFASSSLLAALIPNTWSLQQECRTH